MEEVVPPPLPPKTKRTPPTAATTTTTTVLTKSATEAGDVDVLNSRIKEVHLTAQHQSHVVKIQIYPEESKSIVSQSLDNNNSVCDASCIRISVNNNNNTDTTEMIHNGSTMGDTAHDRTNPYFYYGPFNCGVMSSGQVSPSDTLDSGTCSDLDGTPPPLPKKKNAVSVTLIGGHKRAPSSTSSGADVDSDDNESSISCDSLNSGKVSPISNKQTNGQKTNGNTSNKTIIPATLLHDIRQRNVKLVDVPKLPSSTIVDEKPYEERKEEEKSTNDNDKLKFDTDMYYKFHINECDIDEQCTGIKSVIEDETFAGYKDLLGNNGSSTIRSAKGTVRGVKNRVRAGIATFLQINNSTIKSYIEKEEGKVVVYTTSLGVLRNTFEDCMKVKKILRTLLIKFDEKDVFMSREYQDEIKERMRCDQVLVPQVFVSGQHVGDAVTIEILNESGELRKMLKPFKSSSVLTTCNVCGGYRLLPCPDCNGSKKSVHRNDFTSEFVALKCMKCDEVGLVNVGHVVEEIALSFLM